VFAQLVATAAVPLDELGDEEDAQHLNAKVLEKLQSRLQQFVQTLGEPTPHRGSDSAASATAAADAAGAAEEAAELTAAAEHAHAQAEAARASTSSEREEHRRAAAKTQ
jgi:hypothetical protein